MLTNPGGAGEIAQWGEYSLHKPEALSSNPQHPCEKQVWKPTSVIPAPGRQGYELLELTDSQNQ